MPPKTSHATTSFRLTLKLASHFVLAFDAFSLEEEAKSDQTFSPISHSHPFYDAVGDNVNRRACPGGLSLLRSSPSRIVSYGKTVLPDAFNHLKHY